MTMEKWTPIYSWRVHAKINSPAHVEGAADRHPKGE
jgi:hypothetical protein